MQDLDVVTGTGIGDMLIATYDPALKSAQLAADSEVLHLASTETVTGQKLFKGFYCEVTDLNAATYDILASDVVINVLHTTVAAVTNIKLMTAQVVKGRIFTIKDAGGNAGTNNITITTEGAETIDGAATFVINSNYGAVNIYCDGTNYFIY